MKVFVISLKRSPERRRYIEKQLDDLNIKFEFFDAVDGRNNTNGDDDIDDTLEDVDEKA